MKIKDYLKENKNATTIFGNESFFDKNMVQLYEDAKKNVIIDRINEQIQLHFNIDAQIDKERLRKWINLCLRLENIEESELIKIATRMRINKLKKQVFELKEELKETYIMTKNITCNNILEKLAEDIPNIDYYKAKNIVEMIKEG